MENREIYILIIIAALFISMEADAESTSVNSPNIKIGNSGNQLFAENKSASNVAKFTYQVSASLDNKAPTRHARDLIVDVIIMSVLFFIAGATYALYSFKIKDLLNSN